MKQLTLKQLLEDPAYERWFKRKIELREWAKGYNDPWIIYVQKRKKGSWARLTLPSYPKALKWALAHIDDYYDITICSKRQAFPPPIVKSKKTQKRYYWPNPPEHVWCPYCRRPTKFKFFSTHHAIRDNYGDINRWKRCSICGVRLKFIKQYRSQLKSRWFDR